jgi:hypothetical protein
VIQLFLDRKSFIHLAGLGADVAHVLGLEANTWIASALMVNAYSIDRVAIPPDVGTCAPIRIGLFTVAIW